MQMLASAFYFDEDFSLIRRRARDGVSNGAGAAPHFICDHDGFGNFAH
jgi:hypothetical protein